MTDHRAVAADLMAETAACPDASEHLLAAIHDLLAERLPEPLDPPDTAISVPSSGISWPKAKGGFVPQPSYDAEGFVCAGCGRSLPCRHCLDTPKSATNATESDEHPTQAPQDHQDADRASTGRIGWLRLRPTDEYRFLMREVQGGWADDDQDVDPIVYRRETLPDAEFTPIPTAGPDEAVVKRGDLLRAVRDADSRAIARLRAALGGEER